MRQMDEFIDKVCVCVCAKQRWFVSLERKTEAFDLIFRSLFRCDSDYATVLAYKW